MDLAEALVNVAGFAIIIIATYMIVRNVVQPRIFFPWFRRRETEQLLERGRWLLDEAELDDGEREQVERAIKTLEKPVTMTENWTREDPFIAARTEINDVWLRHAPTDQNGDILRIARGN